MAGQRYLSLRAIPGLAAPARLGHVQRQRLGDRAHLQRGCADQLTVPVADESWAFYGDLAGPQLLDAGIAGKPPGVHERQQPEELEPAHWMDDRHVQFA